MATIFDRIKKSQTIQKEKFIKMSDDNKFVMVATLSLLCDSLKIKNAELAKKNKDLQKQLEEK
jgi:hypothetical protein